MPRPKSSARLPLQDAFTHFYLLPRARRMRKEPTFSERILWARLRGEQLGVKFRRQHPIGPVIVDFFCYSCALVVEVDGSVHDSEQARLHDCIRDQALVSLGLRVIRVKAWLVERDIEAVLDVIRAAL